MTKKRGKSSGHKWGKRSYVDPSPRQGGNGVSALEHSPPLSHFGGFCSGKGGMVRIAGAKFCGHLDG